MLEMNIRGNALMCPGNICEYIRTLAWTIQATVFYFRRGPLREKEILPSNRVGKSARIFHQHFKNWDDEAICKKWNQANTDSPAKIKILEWASEKP